MPTIVTKIPYITPEGEIDTALVERSAHHAAIYGQFPEGMTYEEKYAAEHEHFFAKALAYQTVAQARLARGEKLA